MCKYMYHSRRKSLPSTIQSPRGVWSIWLLLAKSCRALRQCDHVELLGLGWLNLCHLVVLSLISPFHTLGVNHLAIGCSNIRQSGHLEVQSADVNVSNLGVFELAAFEDLVHDVAVALSLEGWYQVLADFNETFYMT